MTTKTSKYTYFYIHDHLGSTSMVLDIDGNITQSVTYVPYGEIFVEERNGAWNSPYLFNSKELDEETGLYYYGARYLNPTKGMWLSTDPLFEKYVGMSPYNYYQKNGFADRNAIQASNLYHRIRGDGLLRTGTDHDNFGLQNPAYFNSTYNWLKAIDQNPNINIHIYSNEKENYIQYKSR